MIHSKLFFINNNNENKFKFKITGKVLTDHILEIFKEYDLTEDQVKQHVTFLSDRGANIRYGLIREGFVRLTCYAHIVHNLVMHMLEDPCLQEIIKLCTRLCSYVKNSGLNSQLKTSLKLYTPTRWSSLFMMLDAIIKMYQDVYNLLVAKQRLINEARMKSGQNPDNNLTDLITNLPLQKMTQMRDFLEPFAVRVFYVIFRNYNSFPIINLIVKQFVIMKFIINKSEIQTICIYIR